MVRHRLVGAALVAVLLAFLGVISLQAQGPGVLQDRGIPALAAEPPMLGIHWARGEAPPSGGGAGSNPNLIWHNGAIMPSVVVAPIYWGPSWGSTSWDYKRTGMATFYQGVHDTNYDKTNTEYDGPVGIFVNSDVTYGSAFVDTSSVPKTVSKITTPTANEVCKMIGSHGVANGYYPVYTDMKRGSAQFCAYHSYTTCSGVPVQYAFFFNLDGDKGCDPQDNSTGHPQGLAAIANVSGHELSEMQTDPRSGGWYDSSGAENADKCAWTFGQSPLPFSPVGGTTTSWKIQGNWSNAAYNSNQGYGPRGCIDGTN